MKHIAVIVSAAAAGALGMGVAVPALASTGSSPAASSSSSLSSSQLQSIEEFLADHPNLAQALAGRAADWQKFLAANPAIKTELDKVAGMPADQRRAALKTWLQANPTARQALQKYRIGLKQARLTRQQDRLKQRLSRIGNPPAGSGSSSSSSSGSSDSSSSSSSA